MICTIIKLLFVLIGGYLHIHLIRIKQFFKLTEAIWWIVQLVKLRSFLLQSDNRERQVWVFTSPQEDLIVQETNIDTLNSH